MTVQQNKDRILTTHVGSLPRPTALLNLLKARFEGVAVDQDQYAEQVRAAVAACVRRQAETGIDIPTDGEQSKPGFFTYVRDRLEGFEARPNQRSEKFQAEV